MVIPTILVMVLATLTTIPPCAIYYGMHPDTDRAVTRLQALVVLPLCMLGMWGAGWWLLRIWRVM